MSITCVPLGLQPVQSSQALRTMEESKVKCILNNRKKLAGSLANTLCACVNNV